MEYYQQCREVFMKCVEQFQSNEAVRSLFSHGILRAYLNVSPEGGTTQDRVERVLDLIGDETIDRQRVILLFIKEVRDRYHVSHPLFAELCELLKLFSDEEVRVAEIPVVIGAMVDTEVEELNNGHIFTRPNISSEERIHFEEFCTQLNAYTPDWTKHYYAERNAWVPFLGRTQSIMEIVWETAARANEKRLEQRGAAVLRPISLSESFFSKENSEHTQAWEQICGGIMIIDSVSLFHPVLRDLLIRSHASLDPTITAVFVLYPGALGEIPVNQSIEKEILIWMEREFKKFTDNFDKMYEFGPGSIYTFQRWLYAAFMDAGEAVMHNKPQANHRDRVRQMMGTPAGIERLVFGDRRRA